MNPVPIEIQTSRGTRIVHLRPGVRVRLGSRAGSADIVYEREPDLDAVHLTIHSDGESVVIEDAGSASGTFINGRRIRRQELRAGETARAAGVTIRLAGARQTERTESARPLPVDSPKPAPRAQPVPDRAAQSAVPVITAAPAPPSITRSGLSISDWSADELSAFRRGAGERLFAVLDLARDKRIHRAILTHPDKFECLYEGNRALQFTAVAPYLVEIDPDSKLFGYLREAGWGNSWGIYVISAQDFPGVRRHLRRFLMVRLPEGGEAYFRFYDPRVLRSFLPVCDAEQANELFAAVSAFVAESENPAFAKRFEFTARPAPSTAARGWRGR